MNNRIRKTLPITFIVMMLLVGCGNGKEQYTDELGYSTDLIGGRFVVVDTYKDRGRESQYYDTTIVYDKDTKVMYYILDGVKRTGLCPVYDTYGNVMVYGGETDAN